MKKIFKIFKKQSRIDKVPMYNMGAYVYTNLMQYQKKFLSLSNFLNINYKNEYGTTVEVNEHGFRCDDFLEINKHDGKHILFAGCSNTWGVGLNKEESWPWKVYSDISKKEDLSGYFNIAMPGASISQLASWTFKYINTYGKPDTIFMLLPNLGRLFSYSPNFDIVLGSAMNIKNKSIEGLTVASHIGFEMYAALEQYCIESGIRLITTSWSGSENRNTPGPTMQLFNNKFETFYDMDDAFDGPISEMLYKYESEDGLSLIARDGDHPGEAMNMIWTDTMLWKYYETN